MDVMYTFASPNVAEAGTTAKVYWLLIKLSLLLNKETNLNNRTQWLISASEWFTGYAAHSRSFVWASCVVNSFRMLI